jgi:chemotaxis signal transduction protein
MSDVHAESAENHHASRKFLTFLVDAVSYAVHIRHVVEIIGMQHITPLPGAPPHIRGVINLRGAVIPVMDLHARFGLEQPASQGWRMLQRRADRWQCLPAAASNRQDAKP